MSPDARKVSRRTPAAIALVGLAGCAGRGFDASRPVTLTVPAATAAPVATSEPPRPVLPPARLRPLFADGTEPVIPVPAQKLDLGTPMESARRAAPELFAEAPYRFADVEVRAVGDVQGKLRAVELTLPRASALADAMALWGQPIKGYDRRAKTSVYYWFNQGARLRARLEEEERLGAPGKVRLTLDRYTPVAELFGMSAEHLGFETEPLIGMKGDRAAIVYGDALPPDAGGAASAASRDLCSSELLLLPPVDFDDVPVRVRVRCAPAGVASFEITLRYDAHLEQRDEIRSLLHRKLGPPASKTDIMGRDVLEYSGNARRLRLLDDEATHEISITVLPRAKRSP